MKRRSHKFMFGAIVGGTLAAMTSLLFKTKQGKKMQMKLMKKFQELNKNITSPKMRKKAARKVKLFAARGWKKAMKWKKAA